MLKSLEKHVELSAKEFVPTYVKYLQSRWPLCNHVTQHLKTVFSEILMRDDETFKVALVAIERHQQWRHGADSTFAIDK